LNWEREADHSLVHLNYVGQTKEGGVCSQAIPEGQDGMQQAATHTWA